MLHSLRCPTLPRFLVFGLALAAPHFAGASATAAPPDVITAGGLIEGALPNGFRHVLLPHAGAASGISLRLVVHAGSLDERDDERGYAHFVEHMAFNGTRHFPAGKLVELFQRLGLAFGDHATASTSFTYTMYRIDLPASQAAQLPAALQVLRDFADGILFDPAEVRRERGVLLSELSARDDDDFQAETQLLEFYYDGTLVPARPPRGDSEQIKRANATRLRGFYERCYRPRRMTLLAVGDLPPDTFAALAADHFGTLAGRGPEIPRVAPTESPARGLRARVVHRRKSTAASVTVTTSALRPADARADQEETFAEAIVLRMLDRRLDERRLRDRERFGFSAASRSYRIDGAFACRMLELHSRIGDWTSGFAALEGELRHARETGFSAAEIAEAGAIVQAQLRQTSGEFAGETTSARATRVAAALVTHRVWQSPAEVLAAAEAFVPRFTPAAAAETLSRVFPEDELRLVLTVHPEVRAAESEVLDAWRQGAAQPLDPSAGIATEQGELVFKYIDFGAAGSVTAHRIDPDLSLHAVQFANGVRLTLRPSTIEPGQFRLTARIGSGLVDLPKDKPGLGLLALLLLGSADLQRHTQEEFGRLIRLRGISGGIHLYNGEVTEVFAGPVASLAFTLQWLTAFMSDVKFEPERLPQALSFYASEHSSTFSASRRYTNAESVFLLAGADPRLQFPPRSGVEQYPFDELTAWIRDHWLKGPLEIGLAGDFSVDEVVAAAAATVGTLPPRTQPQRVANAAGLVLGDKPFRRLSIKRLPDRAATVRVLWPAPAAADPRTYRSLRVAAQVLEDRLERLLREKQGVTYSPNVLVSRNAAKPAFAAVIAEFTCRPDKAGELADRIIRLGDAMARDGISAEEFGRLREPLITSAAEALRSNAWWVENVLPYAQSQPELVDEARAMTGAYADLSRDEVNRAAATHLRRDQASVCGIIPGEPPPPKPGKQQK